MHIKGIGVLRRELYEVKYVLSGERHQTHMAIYAPFEFPELEDVRPWKMAEALLAANHPGNVPEIQSVSYKGVALGPWRQEEA